jgi:hypothetical protein
VLVEANPIRRQQARGFEGTPIIDCDVHNVASENLSPFLSERSRAYLSLVGPRNTGTFGGAPARPGACRLDAFPPRGGPPGSGPAFAREQLLDEYGIGAAVINNLEHMWCGNADLEVDVVCRRHHRAPAR